MWIPSRIALFGTLFHEARTSCRQLLRLRLRSSAWVLRRTCGARVRKGQDFFLDPLSTFHLDDCQAVWLLES
jgi:hypothetical protein